MSPFPSHSTVIISLPSGLAITTSLPFSSLITEQVSLLTPHSSLITEDSISLLTPLSSLNTEHIPLLCPSLSKLHTEFAQSTRAATKKLFLFIFITFVSNGKITAFFPHYQN